MENQWPGNRASKHGSEFTEFLRFKNATWIWSCPKCGKDFPRKKLNGKVQMPPMRCYIKG